MTPTATIPTEERLVTKHGEITRTGWLKVKATIEATLGDAWKVTPAISKSAPIVREIYCKHKDGAEMKITTRTNRTGPLYYASEKAPQWEELYWRVTDKSNVLPGRGRWSDAYKEGKGEAGLLKALAIAPEIVSGLAEKNALRDEAARKAMAADAMSDRLARATGITKNEDDNAWMWERGVVRVETTPNQGSGDGLPTTKVTISNLGEEAAQHLLMYLRTRGLL